MFIELAINNLRCSPADISYPRHPGLDTVQNQNSFYQINKSLNLPTYHYNFGVFLCLFISLGSGCPGQYGFLQLFFCLLQ